jgi:hypothetical protein
VFERWSWRGESFQERRVCRAQIRVTFVMRTLEDRLGFTSDRGHMPGRAQARIASGRFEWLAELLQPFLFRFP